VCSGECEKSEISEKTPPSTYRACFRSPCRGKMVSGADCLIATGNPNVYRWLSVVYSGPAAAEQPSTRSIPMSGNNKPVRPRHFRPIETVQELLGKCENHRADIKVEIENTSNEPISIYRRIGRLFWTQPQITDSSGNAITIGNIDCSNSLKCLSP